MKPLEYYIKKELSDFIVEEVFDKEIKEKGDYQIFILTKSNLSTIQVVRFLASFYRLKPSDIGFAGLKDRFAITKQYLSFPSDINIPERVVFQLRNGKWEKTDNVDFSRSTAFSLEKIGYSDSPIKLGDNRGNLFSIKIHNLNREMRRLFYENLDRAKIYGFPNYFGEQRFGSVKGRNDFIFLYLLKGETEKALKLYFSIKGSVKNWGNWEKLYRDLRGVLENYERDLILGLKRGLSFEKAVRILPKNIRLMFNFAFQSYLWNEYLRRYIEKKYPYKRVPFIHNWYLSYYIELYDLEYMKDLKIPYLNRDYRTEDDLLKGIIEKTLEEKGIREEHYGKEIAGIKVLTDGERPAITFPQDIRITDKTKKSLRINFFLPTGSYATVFLRALLY
ncbi:MAG TPA: tRNA pseudouridine(13) synthase TruD [Persephonella sp.]|uniref:tRNA pseudouridine synthase D n=1 Tax=Persephonella marina (strain DSM 14350 / EX-H1) TaxID=123214 RepID=C0QUJ5_PERMH|nr:MULTISPECIES: tRNA pseudouridine(13) synthase TruD [Persephonella]ACO03560.1 tRNA pseudouridine synthase D [Persephonella marina EX-H1]HCB70023.1 tRNA pseudouridine(13) synthase TruD [Persephonella sp.]